jgi:hypothetical protein
MCACHRTSPKLTLPASDGLSRETYAERRGLHYPKLLPFTACRNASGVTAD